MKKLLFFALAFIFLATSAQGKTLKMALDADPESMDPHVQLSGGMLQYTHLCFDPLIRWTKDMKFEPRLATKWERIDDLTVRFYLREGVKFHSGNTFTAADVAWTMDRLKKSEDFKGLFTSFAEPKIIDDYTIDIITTEPYPLVENMATYIFPLDSKFYTGTDEKGLPKDAIVKTEYSFANQNQSGSGPFYVESREQGVKMVYKRFADYWDKDSKGNVSEIILTPIKENATRTAALLSGGVDFIAPVPPQDFNRLSTNKDINLVSMAGSRIITFQLNQKRKPEFANLKVRQAIIAAIDNAGIVAKLMKGTATAAQQQGPEGFDGYVEDLTPRFDLAKAKQLMKEAGFEKGFEATMIAPNNRYVNDEKIAEAVVSMLSKIGIKISLKTMPKAQYWDEFDAQVADIQMVGWHSDTEDSANYSEYLLMCPNKDTGKGQYNSGNYCNAKLDELVNQANVENDRVKRRALLQEVEKIAYEDAAYVPLHWQNLSWAAKKGVNIEPVVNIMDFPYLGDLVVE
ncbi:MAG: ABC transporter substrate-binding protein [Desulfomicrobium apsheronum]|nr:ABC transporter substrate-binding protein [Desulfomicrobium apsheronum]